MTNISDEPYVVPKTGQTLILPESNWQLIITSITHNTYSNDINKISTDKINRISEKRYDLEKMKTLLWNTFSSSELRDLCCYNEYFQALDEQLPQGDNKKGEIIRQIIRFAKQKGILDVLAEWVKKENPRKYKYMNPEKRDTSKLAKTHPNSDSV